MEKHTAVETSVEDGKVMETDSQGIPTSFVGMKLEDVLPKMEKPWYRTPHLIKLNFVLLAALLMPATNGFDGSMVNGLQTLPIWQENFNHPKGGILGLLAQANTIGFVAALPISGWIADRFGRRIPIRIGSTIMIIGAALQTASQNIGMFIAARIILGFGLSIASIAAPALIAELSYPTHRGKITAMFNTSWFFGAIIAAWSTFGTFHLPNSWSWRIPSAIQAAPSLIQLCLSFFVPESPRWLINNDRREEAHNILAKYHADGDIASPLVMFEMSEISAAIRDEKVQKATTYKAFFATAGNFRRLFIIVVLGIMQQASGNGLISFYLALILKQIGITDPTTQNLLNGGLQIFNYATALSSAFSVDRFGRRTLMLFAFVGMFFSYLLWTILSALNEQGGYSHTGLGIGVVVMIFAFNFFYAVGLTPIPYLYLTEVLPFSLRAKGMMISSFSGLAVGVTGGFVNAIALESVGWKFYIFYVVMLAIEFILAYLFFPETKNRSLENIAEVFDGKDALVGDLDKEASYVHKDVLAMQH